MDDDDQTTLPMSPGAAKERDERILKAVERCGRSPCFWWLYDRYESMRTADGKLRMTWRECCASDRHRRNRNGWETAYSGNDQGNVAEGGRAKAPRRGPRLSAPVLRG
jgi:hypothetical protein